MLDLKSKKDAPQNLNKTSPSAIQVLKEIMIVSRILVAIVEPHSALARVQTENILIMNDKDRPHRLGIEILWAIFYIINLKVRKVQF